VQVVVLLGADPVSDFPDRQLAERAMGSAPTLIAVTGHWSPSVSRADVVLPCAVSHERPGTTTNVEGRVSRLGQKVVAPSNAWADWVIAAELAAAFGADLGLASLGEIWSEIERTAPAYRGITQAVLESPDARDGVLAPIGTRGIGQPALPNDPMAVPGIESAERQGAPPRVGRAVSDIDDMPGYDMPGSDVPGSDVPDSETAGGFALGDVEAPHVPPADNYSLRLVASRTLYDAGAAVMGSPSLAPLVGRIIAAANPYDLDRLGVTGGDLVRLRSRRGSLVVPAEPDPGVPRGSVAVAFNVPAPSGPTNAAATLIDAADAVTDVRLETV
jgi:predicted molibdopterin-dependent oxidoreductase YjgC